MNHAVHSYLFQNQETRKALEARKLVVRQRYRPQLRQLWASQRVKRSKPAVSDYELCARTIRSSVARITDCNENSGGNGASVTLEAAVKNTKCVFGYYLT